MKNIFVSIILCMLFIPVIAQDNAADIYVPGDEAIVPTQTIENGQRGTTDFPSNPILYDNGPLVTHPGGGFGGTDASAVQTGLGMNTYGFGHQVDQDNWIADDFTVPSGGWNIGGFGFYAYQTNSGLPSTMTDVYLVIFDGPPDNPASNVVFGNTFTNRLTSSDFSNIYRVLETDLLNVARPIFLNSCLFDLFLPQGDYWVIWQTDGTLTSGPWAPPISVLGLTSTGNGLQSVDNGTTWATALDSGSGTPQGFPFLVYGPSAPVPVSNWAIIIGIGLILAFAVIRFRRLA
jgi:hypothetical protein